jgi:hypothetical protein
MSRRHSPAEHRCLSDTTPGHLKRTHASVLKRLCGDRVQVARRVLQSRHVVVVQRQIVKPVKKCRVSATVALADRIVRSEGLIAEQIGQGSALLGVDLPRVPKSRDGV